MPSDLPAQARLATVLAEAQIGIFGHRSLGPEWSIEDRRLDMDLIYVIESGAVHGELEGCPTSIMAGGACWLPAGYRHRFDGASQEPLTRLYHLRFAPCGLGDGLRLLRRADAVRRAMAQLYLEFHDPGPLQELRLASSLLGLLCIYLESPQATTAPGLDAERRQRLIAYLASCDPAERPQPQQLAKLVGLRPQWFSRVFTASFGMSPRSWLKRERMLRAAVHLAESDDSISIVAGRFGYLEAFRFSRQFREVLGVSPRQWRARHRPVPD